MGKNIKTQTTRRYNTAPMLIKMPELPRLQRRAGSGPPRRRRRMSKVKEMIYVARIALMAKEPMALNATVDPMLISDKRVVMVKVRRTAFKGMFQPGLTFEGGVMLASS